MSFTNLAKQPRKADSDSLAYESRVNRAIDFILQHLDQPLPLKAVASAAGFSPFHFHRIFRLLVGETLNDFVKRVRLERALVLLSRQDWATRRKATLTDIAFACGFTSSSDFSRCFKLRYGVAASRFDVKAYRAKGREDWLQATADPRERNHLRALKPGENPDRFEVRLRQLPPRTVAYRRVMDSFREGAVEAAARAHIDWAECRGLANGQWLGYMWDDPEIVSPRDCRYDVGVVVPRTTALGDVGRYEFPAMLVAEVEIRGGIALELRALEWLFGTWLPASGYVPMEQPCFEAFIGRPFALGPEYFELYAHIPIERG